MITLHLILQILKIPFQKQKKCKIQSDLNTPLVNPKYSVSTKTIRLTFKFYHPTENAHLDYSKVYLIEVISNTKKII